MKKIYLILLLLAGICLSANAQVFTVSGVVKASDNLTPDPTIPGASVIVLGTTIGTITDHAGHFRITCSPNAELEVSALGFITTTVHVNGMTSIVVFLDPDEGFYNYFDSVPPSGGFMYLRPGDKSQRGEMTRSTN